MYIQNRRHSSKFNGYSQLQQSNDLISLEPAIACFAYTYRWRKTKNRMMRNFYYVIGFLIIVIISCDKTYYDYLGDNTIFIYNQNDTLVYKGISQNDTFIVSYVTKSSMISDKTTHVEILDVGLKESMYDCKGDNYNYCGGMHIRRQGSSFTRIEFRNIDYLINKTNSDAISYKLTSGMIIPDVLKISFTPSIQAQNTDIRTLYYIPKYGIIAYH